jgi:hypothetical protein
VADPETDMRLEILERAYAALEEKHRALEAEVAGLVQAVRDAASSSAKMPSAAPPRRPSQKPPVFRVAGAGQSLTLPAKKKMKKELEVVCVVCGRAVLARASVATDQGAACADCYPTRVG